MFKVTSKYRLFYLISTAGITSFTTQIILLREFISVFSGNELVMGVLLANWMFITGAGAFSGKFYRGRISIRSILLLQLLFSALPLATLLMLSYTRFLIFPYGVTLDLLQVFNYSFLVLLPFCFLSGLLFTFYATIFSELKQRNSIRKVYAVEAGGNIAGGLIFNLLLIHFLNPSEYLLSVIVLNAFLIFFISVQHKFKVQAALSFLAGLLAIFIISGMNPEEERLKPLFKAQEIKQIVESPYGRILITSSGDQINYFENGGLFYTTGNVIENEEYVHYLMPQLENPDTVLVISGGLRGLISELSKYKVKHVDYTEINPALLQAEINALDSGRDYGFSLNTIDKDPLIFLKDIHYMYDAVLINLPDPSNAQINRYYTINFLQKMKSYMNADGALSLSLSLYGNYLSEEAEMLFSSIYKTIDSVFPYVAVIPGNKIFLIGSNHPAGFNFQSFIEENKIQTSYVAYYTDTVLMKKRSSELISRLRENIQINTDFLPVAYYYHIRYWLSHSSLKILHLIIIGIFVFLAALVLLSPMNFGLFAGGLAASSTEFIILISFQIMYGYVYYFIGLIITAFMAGLMIGSTYLTRITGNSSLKKFKNIQSLIATYAISVPLLMFILNETGLAVWLIQVCIFLITLITGMITGLQYAVASNMSKTGIKEHAAKTYGADMLGSAVGALVAAVFLVPVLGLVKTGYVLGAINLVALLNLHLRKNQ